MTFRNITRILSGSIVLGALLISMTVAAIAGQEEDYREIMARVQKGEYKDAIKLLRNYNSTYKDQAEGYLLMGRLYLAIGGYNERDLAEKAFKEGLERDPDNIQLLNFMADIKNEQQRSDHAVYYLEKSAQIDPTDPDVIEKTLAHFTAMDDREGLLELEKRIKEWIAAHPDSARGYVSLGNLCLALGKPEEAIKILQDAMLKDVESPAFYKVLADNYLMAGNGALFTEAYYQWLKTSEGDEKLQLEFQISELVMSEQDAARFNEVPLSQKGKWLEQFWRDHDPNPITVGNELLLEHYERVWYSREHFRTGLSPLGFDDRGKIYIKWGPPEERFADPMPNIGYTYDSDLAEYNQAFNPEVDPGTSPPGYGSPMSYAVRGNESWYYPSIDMYLAFDFVNYGGYYRQVMSLAEAIPGMHIGQAITLTTGDGGVNPERQMVNSLKRLYEDRSHLGGFYARMAATSLDNISNELTFEIPSNVTQARSNSKPRHEFAMNIGPLDFTYKPVQFRGDSGRTQVKIAYGLDMKQLLPVKDADSTITFNFQNDLVFFDSLQHRILHRQFANKRVYPDGYDYKDVNYIAEDVCQLFPGEYEMAFQMVEVSNRRGKYDTRDLNIRNFQRPDLMMSDIVLTPKIRTLGFDENTGREKLWIMPFPYNAVSRQAPAYIYFEIYNLALNPNEASNYEISLRLDRRTKADEYVTEMIRSFGRIFSGGKPQRIESVYSRQGNDQTAREYIEFDLSGQRTGLTRLTVTVKDLNSGEETENSVEFELLD